MQLKFLNYFGKRKRHHWTQEGDAFDHLKVAQEHHQEKIRVFNIIFMNVQCRDSCSSFGVPAKYRTSTVFRQLTFDSSNVPAIWKEKKNVLCLRWKITASVTKKDSCYLQIDMSCVFSSFAGHFLAFIAVTWDVNVSLDSGTSFTMRFYGQGYMIPCIFLWLVWLDQALSHNNSRDILSYVSTFLCSKKLMTSQCSKQRK